MTRQFIVCIELHGADPETCEDLDNAMASRFFERIIESDGRIKKLPTGTYVSGPSCGDATAADALRTARAAASEAAEAGVLTWSIVVAATSEELIFDDVDEADA